MLHGVEKDFTFYEICGCHGCGYLDYGIPGVTPCNLADTNALEEPVASIIGFFLFYDITSQKTTDCINAYTDIWVLFDRWLSR